jgi:SHS family lactate transporter-like MFS transporter
MADVRDAPVTRYDPDHVEKMGVSKYLATRLSTLVPPMNKAPNPISALMLLNRQQWLFFLVGFDVCLTKFSS